MDKLAGFEVAAQQAAEMAVEQSARAAMLKVSFTGLAQVAHVLTEIPIRGLAAIWANPVQFVFTRAARPAASWRAWIRWMTAPRTARLTRPTRKWSVGGRGRASSWTDYVACHS